MTYEVVENYYRQEHFDLFSSFANPLYGLSFRLDISGAKRYAEATRSSIYLVLCYLVTRAANALEDFHYRVKDDRIVRYDQLDISATVPVPGGLFSFAYFDFHPDIGCFLEQAQQASRQARQGVQLAEREHFNQLLFTALPKVDFSHFTHPLRADLSDARPNTAFGRFTREGDRLVCSVGLEVNHIFIDGRALGELVERIQDEVHNPRRGC